MFETIPALSIQQPWAWLIIRPDVTCSAARAELNDDGLLKDIENRTWRTNYTGPLYVHASKTIDVEGIEWVRGMYPQIQLPATYDVGGVIGRVRLVDCVDDFFSAWFFGPYGFVLDEPEPLPLQACRGMPGLFWPCDFGQARAKAVKAAPPQREMAL